MPDATPHVRSLDYPIRVYYFDTDAGGVVHNAAYLRMIEQARTELAHAMGWRLEEMRDSGLVPVVARTEIDYLRPAVLGDELLIKGRLAGMERIRFFLEFEIIRIKDQQRLTICKQTMVTVQLPGGRPKPIPEVWVDSYPDLLLP
ncbi:MAG: thioesterase family protein [Verrucomicrobiota bacterium]